MRKVFLLLAAALLTMNSCKQAPKNNEMATPATTAEQADVAEGVTESVQYTDIDLPGPQGQTVKVSDYVGKNKLVLIDFWASWCGPCRAEMPTVVKAYELYHAKGLEIVGVSLDNNKAKWIDAIDALGQKWPQMSDLKGWDCEGALFYGIQSIPANVLIDEHGKIIARDLRGEDLINTLAKLLP